MRVYAEQPAYQGLKRRTVAEIQKNIAAQGKRNSIFRALYSRDEMDKIGVWGRNLERIFNIFTVRSVDSV